MPAKGDLVLVRWVDIVSDHGGDPGNAELTTWETPGFIHGWRRIKGVRCLILSGSRDESGEMTRQSGYTTIPEGCVRRITSLRRGRSTASVPPASGPSPALGDPACE